MADPYILTPQPQDPDELKASVVAYLQGVWPEWVPSEGNLDWQIISAFAERAAIIHESVTDVLRAVFRYYGSELAGVPVIDATAAEGSLRLTTTEPAPVGGYRIRAGEVFGFPSPDGGYIGFQTVADVVIPENFTQLGGIAIVALETGAAGSNLTGAATHDLAFLASAELEAATFGGQDAEDDDTYLARLKAELKLSSPRPILADDYAVLAQRFSEVAAAVALDNYNGESYDVEGVIAIAVKNSSGGLVSQGTTTALETMYAAEKLPGLQVYVIAPTFTDIDIAFAITPWDAFDAEAVREAAEFAARAYVFPGTWGQPDYGDERRWVNEPRVRFLEVAQVIQSVEGVRYLDSLALSSPQVATQPNGDLILQGAAALPRPRTIAGTLT